MRPRRSHILLATGLVVFAMLVLLCWRPVREMLAVRELYRIIDGGRVAALSRNGSDKSPLRPGSWGNKVGQKIFGEDEWSSRYEGFLRFFTDGPIDAVTICGGSLRGDLSGVLARLPEVTHLEIETSPMFTSNLEPMTESVVRQWCKATQAMPQLGVFQIQANAVTDASLEPLRGHPRLHVIRIQAVKVTTKCVETLRTLPALSEVVLGGTSFGPFFSPEEIVAIRTVLPRVVVNLSGR